MRKIFLSLAALTIAVAANAFQLYLQNSDLDKHITITSAVDNPDVLGDGKVAVAFDTEKKMINVTLNNATLKGVNASEAFSFNCDETFTTVVMTLIGKNAIIGEGNYTKPICVGGKSDNSASASLLVLAEDPGTASLEMSGKSIIAQLNYNATIIFGNLFPDAYPITITSTSSNQPVFYGGGGSSQEQQLMFLASDLDITASANNQLTMGLELFVVGGKIRTEGVSVKDNNTLVKDDAPYAGDLKVVCPYALSVGSTSMYPDEEFTPAELKAGSISYDVTTHTATLDNVTIDGQLSVYSSYTAAINLKGVNKFTNTNSETDARILLYGPQGAKLTGEKGATLAINGNSVADAIATSYDLDISGFKKMTIEAAKIGIKGTMELKLSTAMNIKSEEAAISGFESLVLATSGMEWSPAASYNTTKKALVDGDDNVIKNVALTKPAAINQVVSGNAVSSKFIRNGQLYILRDGKTFTVTGQEVK